MTQGMRTYDETELVQRLSELSPEARCLFAASCAERLRAAYRWFHERTGQGDPSTLDGALDALWASLEGSVTPSLSWDVLLDDVMELVPDDEDDSWAVESAYAQNAAAAVAYALRCRQSADPQDAGWAARQVYEALDHWIANRDDVDPNAAGAEGKVGGDPLVQAELTRQNQDLTQLGLARDDALPLVASDLRRRSHDAGRTLFGVPM